MAKSIEFTKGMEGTVVYINPSIAQPELRGKYGTIKSIDPLWGVDVDIHEEITTDEFTTHEIPGSIETPTGLFFAFGIGADFTVNHLDILF